MVLLLLLPGGFLILALIKLLELRGYKLKTININKYRK